MADLVTTVQSVFGTGADAAMIVIGVSIWKLDRRVLRLEIKMNGMRGVV